MNENSLDNDPERQGCDTPDAEPRRDQLCELNPKLKAAWYDGMLVLTCVLFYIADVFTDILVSLKYFHNGDYIWFSLTLLCVLGASIVMMIFSLLWFDDDIAEGVSKLRIIVLHVLQLGPLQRYWKAYLNGKKSRLSSASASSHYNMYIEQWRDITMLRLFEVFIESAPQLVLQLYILAYNRHFDKEKDWLTALSACFSLISVSTSLVSYSKALRDASEQKGKMSWWAFAFQIVWRLSMVASRIVTLVLFASVYKSWILLVIGMHWISMTIWVLWQKTSFCSNKTLEPFFAVVTGFIYVFCFFNAKEGFTRRRLVIFYVVMFIENCILMGMWLPHRHEYGVVFVVAVAMVFGGFVLGVLAMLFYYNFYHPSMAVQFCKCCLVRSHEDENSDPPTGSQILVDIHASRGSVGRSVTNDRTSPPLYETELLPHEPSKLQRRYSLEKQKIKKAKAKRARRSHHEVENGVENGIHAEHHLATVGSETGQQSNGAMGHERNEGDREGERVVGVDICGRGYPEVNGNETGTSVPLKKACDDGLHCGTDDEETGTSVPLKKACDDGLHCGTDDEEETGTTVPLKKACDDGLHCGTDDEETGTTVPLKKACDDGLHCGTDDEEETGTSMPLKKACDDGWHCGTDDEETGTTVPLKKACDDGLHCGTDDEEETGTTVPLKKACDDGLHCGTDDEETETSMPLKKACDDGLHCGTDDEEETGTSPPKGKRTRDALHRGTADEEGTSKGEVNSMLSKIQYSHNSFNLSFQHRYSIVSDCISLSSSSSSDTVEDDSVNVEDGSMKEDMNLSRSDGNHLSINKVTSNTNNNYEIPDTTKYDCAQSSSTSHSQHYISGSLLKAVVPRENIKHSIQKSKQANRVTFPNFVATPLKRGKFSSLRRSRENVVDECDVMKTRRHTVDFSELTSERYTRSSKYMRFINRLKPKKFGSVREELAELSLTHQEKTCVGRSGVKSSRSNSRNVRDSEGELGIQRKADGIQCLSDSEVLYRSRLSPRTGV